MALRGLLAGHTSRQGNRYGMIGMAIAMLTTLLFRMPNGLMGWAAAARRPWHGGGFGAVVARTRADDAMPQLVAFFHALVGLAAVLVAAAALYAPQSLRHRRRGAIRAASLVEMSLGAAIGAITFTGSIIAFLKLDGRMSGKPILLPNRHLINIARGIAASAVIAFVATESRCCSG
jgi:H+-translocating NAD(P) transhydrogenase subunit beta